MATAQGKQGIWFLLFPDRENTGNFVVAQGKFLRHRENILTINAKSMFLFTYFQNILASLRLPYFLISSLLLNELFLPIYLLYYVTFLQVSTKLIQVVLKTNWNDVIGNMYNYFLGGLSLHLNHLIP